MVCEILISVVCGRFEFTKLGSLQSEFQVGNFVKKLSESEGDMSKNVKITSISTNLTLLTANLTQQHSQCRDSCCFGTIWGA